MKDNELIILDEFYRKIFDNSSNEELKQIHTKMYEYFKKLNYIEKRIISSTLINKLYIEENSSNHELDCINFLEVEWADVIFVIKHNFKSLIKKVFEEVYCLKKGISIKEYRKIIIKKTELSRDEKLYWINQGESISEIDNSDNYHYNFLGIEDNEEYKVNIQDFLSQLLIELKLFYNILIVVQNPDNLKDVPSIINYKSENKMRISENEKSLIITSAYYNIEEPIEVNPIHLIEYSRKNKSLFNFFNENIKTIEMIYNNSTKKIPKNNNFELIF